MAKKSPKKTSSKVAKKAVKKTVARKAVKKIVSKAVKKAVASKAAKKVSKKAVAKKAAKKAAKKVQTKVARKAAKKATKKVSKKAVKKAVSQKKKTAKMSPSPEKKSSRASTRKEIKNEARRGIPAFTLEEARAVIKIRDEEKAATAQQAQAIKAAKVKADALKAPSKSQTHNTVSIKDLLGFNPLEDDGPSVREEDSVPKKWLPYYRKLREMLEMVNQSLAEHTEDTLKRLSRDDSGDVSAYGQHLADAGTENFERDFALSQLSSEQEALYEIEQAIQRILNGTYAVCEVTGKPINRERLRAVPFTRYSLEGQMELEKNKRRSSRSRGGLFKGEDDVEIFSSNDDGDE